MGTRPPAGANGHAPYPLAPGSDLAHLASSLAGCLGTDVAGAQCQDHPFSDWTQYQFYEMASFFGATNTRYTPRVANNRKAKQGDMMEDMSRKLMPEIEAMIEKGGGDLTRGPKGLQNHLGANPYAVVALCLITHLPSPTITRVAVPVVPC